MHRNLDRMFLQEKIDEEKIKKKKRKEDFDQVEALPSTYSVEVPQIKGGQFLKMFASKGTMHSGNPENSNEISNNMFPSSRLSNNPYFNKTKIAEDSIELEDKDLLIMGLKSQQ